MEDELRKRGVEGAKQFAEHVERLAGNVFTRETIDHLTKAVTESAKAINKVVEETNIPEDAKRHLLKAERETVLALRDFLDAVLQEIERVEKEGKKKSELKKIEIDE